MTDAELIAVFIAMQAGLRVGEDGLKSDDHLVGYLNPLAKLCIDVKAITARADSPFERFPANLLCDIVGGGMGDCNL